MRKLIIVCFFFCSCESWYLTKSITIDADDIKKVAQIIDTTKSGIENIRAIQNISAGDWSDFWYGILGYTIGGAGNGIYETKQYYSPNAFPQYKGTWFYDWINMPTAGEAFIKWGHPDKVGRLLWSTGDRYGWNKMTKFFGGNWAYAYCVLFVVENGVAGFIRNGAKYGTFWHFNLEFDWKVLTSIIGEK